MIKIEKDITSVQIHYKYQLMNSFLLEFQNLQKLLIREGWNLLL